MEEWGEELTREEKETSDWQGGWGKWGWDQWGEAAWGEAGEEAVYKEEAAVEEEVVVEAGEEAAAVEEAGPSETSSAAGAAADDDDKTVPTAKHMPTKSDVYIEGNSFATEGSANGRCV